MEPVSFLRSQEHNPEPGRPVVESGRILVASSREKVATFDLTGHKIKEITLGFKPAATPAVSDDGLLYLGGEDGRFHCISLEDGVEQWSYNLKTIGFSDAVIASDLVVFQTANDRVMALDRSSGEWRWEYQHIRSEDLAVQGLCPPLFHQGMIFIGLSDGALAAIRPDSGELVWKRRVFSGEQFMDVDAPLEADEDKVYAVSVGGEMAAVSRETGKVFWRYSAGGMAGARLAGDRLYLATDDAEAVSLDTLTGLPEWTVRLVEKTGIEFLDLLTRPAAVGRYLVLVSRGGKLFLLDRDTGEVLGTKNYLVRVSGSVVPVRDSGFVFIDNKGILRLWMETGSGGS